FEAPLKLTEEGQIVFDFPEREKPTETNLMCPRCKERKLMKSQWYYECNFQCGFRIGHTVAQVPISEEIMQELFDTGKTKNKVVGFVSKAGNQFDTCLKFEDERIQFDFDNPGETPAGEPTQSVQPWLAEDSALKNVQEQQAEVREETMKSYEDENVESLQEVPEPAADDYWASLMAGAVNENAMNEEMDSMILSEQMLEDDGLPWN
ncbi:MAG: topoisomerase C-terminal repeat-containing protein, partial [Lachnospiraceae bacterium]|nr:topoisomerase C-terminal repeat-containing protein [Lachnospiraceae bacterium]